MFGPARTLAIKVVTKTNKGVGVIVGVLVGVLVMVGVKVFVGDGGAVEVMVGVDVAEGVIVVFINVGGGSEGCAKIKLRESHILVNPAAIRRTTRL